METKEGSMKFSKLLIATHNPAKKARYASVVSSLACEVVSLADFGVKQKPVESGKTAEENACIKARFYSHLFNLPVYCEDEALYVDFLPAEQQPGTFVRRIEGVNEATDDELLLYWSRIIAGVLDKERTGRWHIAYSLGIPDGQIKVIGIDHPIRFYSPPSSIVIPGWPLSSLQGSIRYTKPHSELSIEERRNQEDLSNKEILEALEKLVLK